MHENTWTPVGGSPRIMDFSKCRDMEQFHEILRKAFGFPCWYGKNLDALWDLLDEFFEEDETWEILIHGWYEVPQSVLKYVDEYWSVFEDVEKKYPGVRFILKS